MEAGRAVMVTTAVDGAGDDGGGSAGQCGDSGNDGGAGGAMVRAWCGEAKAGAGAGVGAVGLRVIFLVNFQMFIGQLSPGGLLLGPGQLQKGS